MVIFNMRFSKKIIRNRAIGARSSALYLCNPYVTTSLGKLLADFFAKI